jgi:hypothetical protein
MSKTRKGKRMQMFSNVTIPPTPERMLRGELEVVEVELHNHRDVATIDLRVSMLDRYFRDMLLAPEGDLSLARARYDAGLKLAMLYDQTGYRRGITGAYGPRGQGGEMDDEQDEFVSGKRKAYNGIVGRLQQVSIGAASAVVNLCCHDFDPVDRRDLIRGLDCLAKHWGMGS